MLLYTWKKLKILYGKRRTEIRKFGNIDPRNNRYVSVIEKDSRFAFIPAYI
jgi:hypothetical protein